MKGLQNFTNKTLVEILTKMCEMANVKPEEIDFDSPNWFSEHTWTEKQQDEFREWLITYFSEKGKGIKRLEDVARFPRLSARKKELPKFADWFIFNYGWRCIYE